jgi:antitoxin component YwqK of YwqJK toxin-antitoxin module
MRRLLPLALVAAAACAHSSPREEKPQAAQPGQPTAAELAEMQPAAGEKLSEIDVNRDGKADVWKIAKEVDGKEVLVRKFMDLNGDGRIDAREYYNADGSLEKVVYDMDFDGQPDVVRFYEKDQLVRKEYALGFDGVSRTLGYYEKGKLIRKERDTNHDGNVDYWEYWEGGVLDRIGYDDDGDGQVDRWESKKVAAAAAEEGAPVDPLKQ